MRVVRLEVSNHREQREGAVEFASELCSAYWDRSNMGQMSWSMLKMRIELGQTDYKYPEARLVLSVARLPSAIYWNIARLVLSVARLPSAIYWNIARLVLSVARLPSAIYWNIVFPLMAMNCFALFAFCLPAGELGDRLGLLVTLLLTVVAFQHLIRDKLPSVPYLTVLDKYTLCSFFFVILVSLASSWANFRGRVNDNGRSDFLAAVTSASFLVLFHLYFAVRACQNSCRSSKQSRKAKLAQTVPALQIERGGRCFPRGARMTDGRSNQFDSHSSRVAAVFGLGWGVVQMSSGLSLPQCQITRHDIDVSDRKQKMSLQLGDACLLDCPASALDA
eukprot:g23901.t1